MLSGTNSNYIQIKSYLLNSSSHDAGLVTRTLQSYKLQSMRYANK